MSEGRRREFAGFGFSGEVPNPEDRKTFEMSKLQWEERDGGKHAEMLGWVKGLIKLRHGSVCLNDGDMHHLVVVSDEERQTLVMERDEARILINFGKEPWKCELLKGEELRLISRDGVGPVGGSVELPGMTLAVLMSPKDAVEDRHVAAHTH